jgi:hypothetical protein
MQTEEKDDLTGESSWLKRHANWFWGIGALLFCCSVYYFGTKYTNKKEDATELVADSAKAVAVVGEENTLVYRHEVGGNHYLIEVKSSKDDDMPQLSFAENLRVYKLMDPNKAMLALAAGNTQPPRQQEAVDEEEESTEQPQAPARVELFTKELKQGMPDDIEVEYLQQTLNMFECCNVAVSGNGSPGKESKYFGSRTSEALKKFKEKFKGSIESHAGDDDFNPRGEILDEATRAFLNDTLSLDQVEHIKAGN